MPVLRGREEFQSDDCPRWWGLVYVRPVRPSHHAGESILRVHMCQVRYLELGTFEPITTYRVKALLNHSPPCLPLLQKPSRAPRARHGFRFVTALKFPEPSLSNLAKSQMKTVLSPTRGRTRSIKLGRE